MAESIQSYVRRISECENLLRAAAQGMSASEFEKTFLSSSGLLSQLRSDLRAVSLRDRPQAGKALMGLITLARSSRPDREDGCHVSGPD